MDSEMKLLPCPFCGDPMEESGQILRHVDQTPSCPVRQNAWPVEALAAWNFRTPDPAKLREALDLARNRLRAAAINAAAAGHKESYEYSEWADEADAALSPAG
jgi:hypothetical protein